MAFPESGLFQKAGANARGDAKVKPAVKNTPAYAGMDVEERLRGCASADPKHIQQGDSGPQVAIIHQALEKIAAAALQAEVPSGVPTGPEGKEAKLFNAAVKALRANPVPGNEREIAKYGPGTARAVRAYKTAREIRRTPSSGIDDIVGIMTIHALDRDLLIAEKGVIPPPGPQPQPKPGDKTPVDFVIAFVGGAEDTDRSASRSSSNLNLGGSNFEPLDPDKANGARFRHRINGRRLHCIGRGSRTPDSDAVTGSVLLEMIQVLRDTTLTRGKVFIRGGSAGGRNALKLATNLTKGGVALEMVAAMDAAFFAFEADKTPEVGLDLRPKNAPTFGAKLPYLVKANTKINFFQTKQNRIRPSLSADGKVDWTSIEDNLEIHGKLTDFEPNNRNLDNSIDDNDGLAHGNAVGLAEKLVSRMIRDALDA